MSLINQVLNDLEKRGSGVGAELSAIRAVPVQNKWPKTIAIVAVVLVLATVAAGVSLGLWPKSPAPEIAVPVKIQPAAPPSSVLSAASQPQPASSTLATQEEAAPASLLSLELSLIPATISPHDKRTDVQAAQTQPSRPVRQRTAAQTAEHPVPVAKGTSNKEVPIKRVSPQQHAEDEFNQAMALIRAGRNDEAFPHLETALSLNPLQVQARQALSALLIGDKRNADAERVLQEGLNRDIKQAGFAMLLARLQVERGSIPQAQETLQKTLPYAAHQADYQAFVAALLQRQEHHDEAIAHYQTALQLSPNNGAWLVGLGISLQAMKRNAEARDAFQHAIKTHSLSAGLQDFVGQRLKEL